MLTFPQGPSKYSWFWLNKCKCLPNWLLRIATRHMHNTSLDNIFRGYYRIIFILSGDFLYNMNVSITIKKSGHNIWDNRHMIYCEAYYNITFRIGRKWHEYFGFAKYVSPDNVVWMTTLRLILVLCLPKRYFNRKT